MTVFLCARCSVALTPDLAALPTVPDAPDEADRDPKTRRLPSTVPLGHYAVEPDPWGAPYIPQDDQNPEPCQPRGNLMVIDDAFVISAGPRNTVVIHPDDAPALQPLPNWENSSGCCGPTGQHGPNRACPCGNQLATLAADCYTPYELHLDPVRVHPVEGWPGT
ncbi:hypothetical protein ONA91_23305 [Micromonospora sp. DR5-3]|uniref:hypothetical protein n=1 Tax=unclassified Micromonospora TaxID=2617518 RepID=UPI0011D555E7|nr:MULTISPECIES: hypothetical protein [unclassified Micromonospora]MCW3817382.1 hypothetical protein [Micromonospora sp. DR5-3]TYC19388.1 hypothetical protein FXF52_36930 [Micromonospora sp. MP36]